MARISFLWQTSSQSITCLPSFNLQWDLCWEICTKIWWEYSLHCCQKWTCQRPSLSCSQLSRCSTRWTWRTILLAIHLTTFNSHKRKLTVFGLGHKEWLLEPFRHLITVIKTKREFDMVMPGQFHTFAMLCYIEHWSSLPSVSSQGIRFFSSSMPSKRKVELRGSSGNRQRWGDLAPRNTLLRSANYPKSKSEMSNPKCQIM